MIYSVIIILITFFEIIYGQFSLLWITLKCILLQNTALHLATKHNKPEAVSLLLSAGCKIIENNIRFKPIDYAIQLKLHESAIAIVTHARG